MKPFSVIRVSTFAVLLAMLALTTRRTTLRPWEQGNLADGSMQADRNALPATMTGHLTFSREASTGGRGGGGGGCN